MPTQGEWQAELVVPVLIYIDFFSDHFPVAGGDTWSNSGESAVCEKNFWKVLKKDALMNYIDWISGVKSTFHSWVKPYLVVKH